MKSKITTLFLVLSLSLSSHVFAQCNDTLFYADFSSATAWNKSGTGNIAVTNGACTFTGANDRMISRVHKPIGAVLDNDYWKTECHLKITSPNPSVNGYHVMVMGLTKGALDFGSDESGRETTQDGIAIVLNSDNPADGDLNKAAFYLQIKKGSTRGQSNTGIYAKSGVTDYYIRLERIDGSNMKLSIFTNEEMTEELGTALSLTVESTITDFNTIQHGVIETEIVERRISATIDDDYICYFNADKVSVQKFNTLDGVSIFPNPAVQSININTEIADFSNLKYSLTNALGEELRSGTLLGSSSQISVAHLPKGIYIVTVSNSDKIFTKRVLKQ